MTDRYEGFLVALDRNLRDDDAAHTIAAIRQIRGVLDVRPVVADAPAGMIAVMRERLRLHAVLWEAINPVKEPPDA